MLEAWDPYKMGSNIPLIVMDQNQVTVKGRKCDECDPCIANQLKLWVGIVCSLSDLLSIV